MFWRWLTLFLGNFSWFCQATLWKLLGLWEYWNVLSSTHCPRVWITVSNSSSVFSRLCKHEKKVSYYFSSLLSLLKEVKPSPDCQMIKRLIFVNIFPATSTFICVIGWWRVKLFPNFASLPFYYRPNNITGDKLPSQSWVVLVYRINNSTHSELRHNVIWL